MKSTSFAQLKITSLSKEGWGEATWIKPSGQSLSIEVPFCLPEEEVEVCLLKKRKGVTPGRLLQILQPSPMRITPRCIHFGACGGCRWQEIPYEQQLVYKEAKIQQEFAPYLSHQQVKCYPIIPCSPPWYYRNKMELTFSQDRAQQRYLGLILYGTRGHVFQMQECHLATPWMVEAVKAVSQWWETTELMAYKGEKDTGSLRTLTLREGQRTGDRLVMLTVSGNPTYALQPEQLKTFVNVLQETLTPTIPDAKLVIFLRIQQIAKGHPTQFYEILLQGPDFIRESIHLNLAGQQEQILHFRISPTAFFQPNTRQAERLYTRALELTELSKEDIVYDLYCGTGTLGICAAQLAKEVIGIELSPESVLDAKENIKLNALTNVSIRQGDVGNVLATLIKEGTKRPTVVFVDPPRAGLDARAIEYLLALKAPKLTYISCNPTTQAANLEMLIQGGYQLQALQAVDQFPQTIHVENIAVLVYKP